MNFLVETYQASLSRLEFIAGMKPLTLLSVVGE